MLVSEVNCHPFQYGRFLWMHNGVIAQFAKIKRRLRQTLSDDVYNSIQGTTDSEHAFGVFLSRLGDSRNDYSGEMLQQAMKATVYELNAWGREAEITDPSYYNFAVTDGQSIIATRYVSDSELEPLSLYYSSGAKFECHDGVCRMIHADRNENAIIIASEPLTDVEEDWLPVPKNHLIMVAPDLSMQIVPLNEHVLDEQAG
jgi:predicted glutamine amidotransferase